jgi:hypothetical protein
MNFPDAKTEREKNRAMFPTAAKICDEFEAIFGKCKLLYASENGNEIGKKPEGIAVSAGDMVIEPKKEKPNAQV